ncbi:hypothetical protein GCM10027575_50310 [Phytohabitans suffuscus]
MEVEVGLRQTAEVTHATDPSGGGLDYAASTADHGASDPFPRTDRGGSRVPPPNGGGRGMSLFDH